MREQTKDKHYRFIELLAFWEGGVNATDVAEQFSFTPKQGKHYMKGYKKLHPHNLKYDQSLKKYFPTPEFRHCHTKHDVTEYLDWLSSKRSEHLALDNQITNTSIQLPARQVSAQTMRALVYAIKHQQAIETDYASLNHPNGAARIIHPHTFVKTGLRWHLRGYSEKHKDYRDFVLSRFSDDTSVDDSRSYQPKAQDVAWNTDVTLILVPNPQLEPEQQQLIAKDYQMFDGQLPLYTKGALAQYLLQEMQIDISQASKPAKQPLVLANLEEVRQWLFNSSKTSNE